MQPPAWGGKDREVLGGHPGGERQGWGTSYGHGGHWDVLGQPGHWGQSDADGAHRGISGDLGGQ